MRWDALIHWMAHVGHGSWASFKRAVASLTGAGADPGEEARRLRTRLSDMGIAEFFIDGTERWRAIQPLLVSSPHLSGEALLCGARTPQLLQELKTAAVKAGCQYFEVVPDQAIPFRTVKIHGNGIARAAAAAGIRFESDIGWRLAREIRPLEERMRTGRRTRPPIGWAARSLDLTVLRWVDGQAPRSAVEYTSRYEERRYLVFDHPTDPLELPKREAVFAAASLRGVRLAAYDAVRGELATAAAAPLPEPLARAACLASGRASTVRSGRIVYEQVPAHLAAAILVALMHPSPPPHTCAAGPPAGRRR